MPAFEQGRPLTALDAEAARAQGLTVVELGDTFTPRILRDDPALLERGKQPYADTYRALADERLKALPKELRSDESRYLELFGIFPTLRLQRARLLDDARHSCHAAIDTAPLVAFEKRLWTFPALPLGKTPSKTTREKQAAHQAAVRVVQQRLACEGLLHKRAKEGHFDSWTADGVRLYQRRHMIISWGIVEEVTRDAMLLDSRELDFRSLLRTLRERVVAATGILEDGTASGDVGTIVGRVIDPPDLHAMHGYGALKNGAPDLVSKATDAAARALGWTSPEAAIAWLSARPEPELRTLFVALPLPSPPAYHATHMELRVEIDRGDVWYGFPYDELGTPIKQPVKRRPTLTLFAKDAEREVALVRWNTTIGGFQPEVLPDGTVGLMYKESEVGSRVWRKVVATPAWLPPESTPDEDLIRREGKERVLHTDVVGPGFASAYGLVMMPLEIEWKPPEGEPSYVDKGIRVHGSVGYRSILKGYSHGCHRLFNHLAIRLSSFLIDHREHVTEGRLAVAYERKVQLEEREETLRLDQRGFGYELVPPVPVQVLKGRIKGQPKRAIQTPMPLPEGYAL